MSWRGLTVLLHFVCFLSKYDQATGSALRHSSSKTQWFPTPSGPQGCLCSLVYGWTKLLISKSLHVPSVQTWMDSIVSLCLLMARQLDGISCASLEGLGSATLFLERKENIYHKGCDKFLYTPKCQGKKKWSANFSHGNLFIYRSVNTSRELLCR